MPDDPRIDRFFADGPWQAELVALRKILLSEGLTETFKWSSPVYCHDNANVAIVWGFREYCGLGFFKGVLLDDPQGLLLQQGANSRSTRILKFLSLAEVAATEPVIRTFLRQAIENEKAGLKVDLPKDDLDWPEELVERLDCDPRLMVAFRTLTPGRQRGYILHFSQAKQSATRSARIEKHAARILAGKGLQDR